MAEKVAGPGPVGVGDATLIALAARTDSRGSLIVGQVPEGLPFVARRFFLVEGAVGGAVRGGHAHRAGEELLVVAVGRVEVVLSNGSSQATVELTTPTLALHVPAGIRTEQRLDEGATLLVLASDVYDPEDHIR